jgi:YidC/Oxa1 family membrane protein insertase
VEKRVIVAVVMSLIVLMIWQHFLSPQQPVSKEGVAPVALPQQAEPIATREATGQPHAEIATSPSEEHVYEDNQFVVTYDNIGGCIKKIDLKEYRDNQQQAYYRLVSADLPGSGIFTITSDRLGITSDRYSYTRKAEGNAVTYETQLPGSIKIIKRYVVTARDTISAELTFINLSNALLTFDYDVIGGTHIERSDHFAERYIQVDANVSGTIVRKRSIRNAKLLHPGSVEWVALKNKYFALILKPLAPSGAAFVQKNADKTLASGIRASSLSLSPGAEATHVFVLYAGPKKTERLAQLDESFKDVIHYGVFGGISQVLLSLLRFFHRITHNWGVSIIMLSTMINFLLYPLTRQSLKSMREMQKLQPEIKQLQDKHKKTPQKLNKEIMELYKTHKVNPFGGCLPLFLQMPIFIALYQGLIRFIELKSSSFLWISDLSLPDSVGLPFLGGKDIHILPILMAGTMFLQQKFSHPQHQVGLGEQQRQQQKMMAVMMPLLFGFIFYNFPSGLVLYWFTNTIFMTANQMIALKKAN